jgi:hypothetical protein
MKLFLINFLINEFDVGSLKANSHARVSYFTLANDTARIALRKLVPFAAVVSNRTFGRRAQRGWVVKGRDSCLNCRRFTPEKRIPKCRSRNARDGNSTRLDVAICAEIGASRRRQRRWFRRVALRPRRWVIGSNPRMWTNEITVTSRACVMLAPRIPFSFHRSDESRLVGGFSYLQYRVRRMPRSRDIEVGGDACGSSMPRDSGFLSETRAHFCSASERLTEANRASISMLLPRCFFSAREMHGIQCRAKLWNLFEKLSGSCFGRERTARKSQSREF